jgi:hypothetical protein
MATWTVPCSIARQARDREGYMRMLFVPLTWGLPRS